MQQRKDVAQRNKELAEEQARYDALWEAQRQLKNAQADAEDKKKQQFAEHIKHALTDQMNEARQRKLEDARKHEAEKLAFVRRFPASPVRPFAPPPLCAADSDLT